LEPIAPQSKAMIGSTAFQTLAFFRARMQSVVTVPTVPLARRLRLCEHPRRAFSLV